MARTVAKSRGQITLPREVREALHVKESDDVAFIVEVGQVAMRGLKSILAEEAWFWTDAWQAGEREASGQSAAGEGTTFDEADSFLDSFR